MLRVLQKDRSKPAQSLLASLLCDETLELRPRTGHWFRIGLSDAEFPSLAAAARRRFGEAVRSGLETTKAADEWFGLVADHGDDAELAWLMTSPDTAPARAQAVVACASSPRIAARNLVTRDSVESLFPDEIPHEIVQGVPEITFEVAKRRVALPERSDRRREDDGWRSLLALACRTVPERRVGEAYELLRTVAPTDKRFAVVYGVEALVARKLDVEPVAALALAPVTALERIAGRSDCSDEEKATLSPAIYAIEHNRRTCWNERAVTALRRVADTPAAASEAERARSVASKIDAALSRTDSWK